MPPPPPPAGPFRVSQSNTLSKQRSAALARRGARDKFGVFRRFPGSFARFYALLKSHVTPPRAPLLSLFSSSPRRSGGDRVRRLFRRARVTIDPRYRILRRLVKYHFGFPAIRDIVAVITSIAGAGARRLDGETTFTRRQQRPRGRDLMGINLYGGFVMYNNEHDDVDDDDDDSDNILNPWVHTSGAFEDLRAILSCPFSRCISPA